MIGNSDQKTILTTTRPTKKQDRPATANTHDDPSNMLDSSKGDVRTRQRDKVGEKTTGSSSYLVDVHAATDFNDEGKESKETAQKMTRMFCLICLQQNEVQARSPNTVSWSTSLDNCCSLLGAINHALPSMHLGLMTNLGSTLVLFIQSHPSYMNHRTSLTSFLFKRRRA